MRVFGFQPRVEQRHQQASLDQGPRQRDPAERDAKALLRYDLLAVTGAVNDLTFTPLNQNQFDALVCFAFNIGIENFRRSSALRRVNEGNLLQAASSIAEHMVPGQCVILKSTTFPNTTEGYVQPILEGGKRKVGTDFHLAFSPERIDPGNKTWHTANTPIVVGGVTPECTKIAAAANRIVIEKVIEVSSPKVAEMEKLLENIFRSVNIALVNELAQLCDRMGGVNIWEVVEAAATKPFGFMPFYPGPGIGGHCILIDPYYLSWLAREYDFVTNFITLAAEVNESMPYYVQRMVLRQIAHMPVSLKDARIVVLGVAFKRDVDDLRHSPALKVMELLTQDGAAKISYVDPYILTIEIFGKTFDALPYSDELMAEADIVVITTDHTLFDYDRIVRNAKVVIDTRNATKNVAEGRQKIHLLGDGKCTQ